MFVQDVMQVIFVLTLPQMLFLRNYSPNYTTRGSNPIVSGSFGIQKYRFSSLVCFAPYPGFQETSKQTDLTTVHITPPYMCANMYLQLL